MTPGLLQALLQYTQGTRGSLVYAVYCRASCNKKKGVYLSGSVGCWPTTALLTLLGVEDPVPRWLLRLEGAGEERTSTDVRVSSLLQPRFSRGASQLGGASSIGWIHRDFSCYCSAQQVPFLVQSKKHQMH